LYSDRASHSAFPAEECISQKHSIGLDVGAKHDRSSCYIMKAEQGLKSQIVRTLSSTSKVAITSTV
jgi:hypothetical protein